MDTVKTALISVDYVTLIISFILNIFIIVVNVQDFGKNRRLPLSDQLLLSLSVFGLLHELSDGYFLYFDLLPGPSNDYSIKYLYFFMYMNLCTLWLSALLSLHFCLKIVNITQRFYIDLQRRFPMLFPWIIIAFSLGYFFMCLYSSLGINPKCLLNTTQQEDILIFLCNILSSYFFIKGTKKLHNALVEILICWS
ncbi:hypothetical protein GDO81_018776 [Engystomops pustulosus]|uniref:Uncharacterized protein n=1 Tax=Engystomops pustulosus TaxID=76066 RepID=A0AAV6ZJX3_ENGPU|nr:hypothetical protein GDO81_018776 [Engystomops pustulosus]